MPQGYPRRGADRHPSAPAWATVRFIDYPPAAQQRTRPSVAGNGVEAEKYASETVRVTKELKWKDWGTRFNLYLTTDGKRLPGPTDLLRARQRQAAQVLAADHHAGAGGRRQALNQAVYRSAPRYR